MCRKEVIILDNFGRIGKAMQIVNDVSCAYGLDEDLALSLLEALELLKSAQDDGLTCQRCGANLAEKHLRNRSYVFGYTVCENCVDIVSVPEWIEIGICRYNEVLLENKRKGLVLE